MTAKEWKKISHTIHFIEKPIESSSFSEGVAIQESLWRTT